MKKEIAKSRHQMFAAIVAMCAASAVHGAGIAPYVEVDGTVGIDTGYCAKNSTRCEIDYSLTDARPSGGAPWYLFAGYPTFSSFINDWGLAFGAVGTSVSDAVWATGISRSISNTPDMRLTTVLDIPNNSCCVIKDGFTNATAAITRRSDYVDRATIKLASNYSADGGFAKMRIYGCRIYEADVLVHDFVPCKMDGAAGFIDNETGEFITNIKQQESISVGGDYVEYKSPPHYTSYIEVDGTVGIDTGCYAKNSTRCELDYCLTETRPSGATWSLFAGYPTFSAFINGSGLGFGVVGTDTAHAVWATAMAKPISDSFLRLSAVLDIPNNLCCIIKHGITNATATITRQSDYVDKATIKLASNYSADGGFSKMRIYGCRIYESDVLVHDFVPCKKDGLVGLMDNVTGEFITNIQHLDAISIGGDYIEQKSPYVEVDGTFGIDTGRYPKNATRCELDYSLTAVRPSGATWLPFAGYPTFCSLINDSGLGFGVVGTDTAHAVWVTGKAKAISDTTFRLSAVLDIPNNSCCVIKDGITNATATITRQSDYVDRATIKLASNDSMNGGFAKMRIYGCRIYEEDVLVHDFVPHTLGPAEDGGSVIGFLKDRITGLSIGYPDATGEKCLTCGGKDILPCLPYVETKRSDLRYIDTGYQVKLATKVELDYAPPGSRAAGDTWYLFGAGGDAGHAAFAASVNDDGIGFINTLDSWKRNAVTNAVYVRRTVVLDNPAGLGSIITEGVTNATSVTVPSGAFGSATLKLSAPADPLAHLASIRIYRCRISEKEGDEYVLKHDFVPAVVNGVAGLQDILPGGEFKSAAAGATTPLTYGGVFDVTVTQNDQKASRVTLTSYAPGATSYFWLRNGELFEGGEDGILTVQRPNDSRTDTYRAVAVYEVGDATMQSTASEEVHIAKKGFVLLFR